MSSDPKGLGKVFDAHTDAEFKTRDIDATMATMGSNPHVNHVPVMTGGCGPDGITKISCVEANRSVTAAPTPGSHTSCSSTMIVASSGG